MSHRRRSNRGAAALMLLAAFALAALFVSVGASGGSVDPAAAFYVPKPDHGAISQIAQLSASGDRADAALIRMMIETPQAVWFTDGTPKQVQQDVADTVARAAASAPFRCWSPTTSRAATAPSTRPAAPRHGDAYKAWIDGFAAGLGNGEAVVILEPDGLAPLPTDCGQPDTYDRVGATSTTRSTRCGSDAARGRLPRRRPQPLACRRRHRRAARRRRRQARAGLLPDVSNYRATNDETTFGTWISKCIAFANNPEEGGWRLGHYDWCASQYYSPFGPVNPDDISTWHYTDDWYAANLGTAVPTTHFVDRHEPQRPGRRGRRRAVIPRATRRTGATRPAAASAAPDRRTPACRCWTPTCG